MTALTRHKVIERHPAAGLVSAAHVVVNRVREKVSTLAAGESDPSKKHP